jgi:xanthine/uracil permease
MPDTQLAPADLAHVIGTIFFISGVITLVQTFFGDRLPIVQGGSFAYLTPAFAIIGQFKARGGFTSEHERFLVRHATESLAFLSRVSM